MRACSPGETDGGRRGCRPALELLTIAQEVRPRRFHPEVAKALHRLTALWSAASIPTLCTNRQLARLESYEA